MTISSQSLQTNYLHQRKVPFGLTVKPLIQFFVLILFLLFNFSSDLHTFAPLYFYARRRLRLTLTQEAANVPGGLLRTDKRAVSLPCRH